MTELTETDITFGVFLKKLNDILAATYTDAAKATITVNTRGNRFIKVSKSTYGSESVWMFIEKTTGNIYKPASWKAPALNFARGNIKDNEFPRINPYGVS
jgi:hypothetical protein